MDMEHLTVETAPAFADVQFLEDRLYEYNCQLNRCRRRTMVGTVSPGRPGHHLGGAQRLDLVWQLLYPDGLVHPNLRRHDIGTQLLQRAEHEARTHGCHQIVLWVTFFFAFFPARVR
jgi:GNAT superfamily N-acetyltransferase